MTGNNTISVLPDDTKPTVRSYSERLQRRTQRGKVTTSPMSVLTGSMGHVTMTSMQDLVAAALALGAENVSGFSAAERKLADAASKAESDVTSLTEAIRAGKDPLGDAFCRIRSAEERRPYGQTYTPFQIVESMLSWTLNRKAPVRVVDTGVGSGRYLLAAGRLHKNSKLIGVDLDPVAALMARANLNAAGLADRAHVELGDFRSLNLPGVKGPTLFVGNPPYVRHHDIAPEWKRWLTETAALYGLKASQLSGLHVHFFLATVEQAKRGDFGAFVTSSEWLDVNYGSLVRQLLVDHLGGQSIHVVAPESMPFSDANTTATITCFEVGQPVKAIKFQSATTIDELGSLAGGSQIAREKLIEAPRWSPLLKVTPKLPEGYIELGELARVHRGAVTGANNVWVTHRGSTELPDTLLRSSVTKARELFAAGDTLDDPSLLRVVIDLPVDLDQLDADTREVVTAFLRLPQVQAAKDGYVAANRKAWWAVGMRNPAPILATYMARRPPAFVRNLADARHINIAHGIYPREPLGDNALAKLSEHLRVSVTLGQGRTYAGGLTKFEPREMERLAVPSLELLNDASYAPTMDVRSPAD